MLTEKDFNEFSKLLTNPPRIRKISFKDFREFYEKHSKIKAEIIKLLVEFSNKLRAIPSTPVFLLIDGEFTKNDPATSLMKFILIYDIKTQPNSRLSYNICNLKGEKFSRYFRLLEPQAVITINPTKQTIESEIFKNDKAEILQLGSDQGEPYSITGLILIDFKEVIL
ncbi:hypothetical protein LEP1GSC186_3284 [Leptospira noguchii serovar Autumnalis str. ZUN142]|uniref:Uncharacterized protein n=1 Tax=Leptospira noguchii serovar Autumnalis str. ZUN142 TaxID=1085540 RepID=M6U3G6_9LEPT|nr:hypothetical protein [Leptospira noguchii]EMO39572.1 hypothetical protein LEP1GSC186_3284 [Leptospira noguchii serovar Autumnalis str. ZUN142]